MKAAGVPSASASPLSYEELLAENARLRTALVDAGIETRRLAGVRAAQDDEHRAQLTASRQETTEARAGARFAHADLATSEMTITDLQAMQGALRVSEERLALAFEASGSLGWWDWDIPGDRLYASTYFSEIYGVDPVKGAAGAPLSAFVDGIHPDDRERVGARIQHAVETAGEFAEEYRLLQADGRVVWVYARGRCYHDDAGKPLRFPGVAIDITGRKTADDALAASEARLSTIMETVPVGILVAEAPSGRIVMGNARLAEILGHGTLYAASSDEYKAFVSYHADGRTVVPEDYPLARICSGECDHAELEAHYQRPNGQRVWIAIVGEAIKGTRGQTIGAVVAISDISARKAADAQQDILNHELSHRLKNTLALVQSIAGQTLRNAPSIEAANETLSARLVTLGRAHDLLLDKSGDNTDMPHLMRNALGLHDDTRQRFIISGPAVAVGSGPALYLTLMLHELATNATKYGALSVPGGVVNIAWSIEPDTETLRLSWTETGGPPVAPPTHKGFGSRLIERGLASAVGGKVVLDYAPQGLTCVLTAPVSGFAEGL